MGASAALVARAAELGLRIHLVANSHGHIDHIFDNAAIKQASGAPLAIHPDDAYRLSGDNIYGFQVEPSVAEQELREGDALAIGQLSFRVLHTPGHSEGSVCLYEADRGLLLSGDVLFRGSYGRTDLSGGDDAQMVASLTRLYHEIPHDIRVLPGHGPETTIELEAAVAGATGHQRAARHPRLTDPPGALRGRATTGGNVGIRPAGALSGVKAATNYAVGCARK